MRRINPSTPASGQPIVSTSTKIQLMVKKEKNRAIDWARRMTML
jgi:hypothetical protein